MTVTNTIGTVRVASSNDAVVAVPVAATRTLVQKSDRARMRAWCAGRRAAFYQRLLGLQVMGVPDRPRLLFVQLVERHRHEDDPLYFVVEPQSHHGAVRQLIPICRRETSGLTVRSGTHAVAAARGMPPGLDRLGVIQCQTYIPTSVILKVLVRSRGSRSGTTSCTPRSAILTALVRSHGSRSEGTSCIS
jgi:hypothetical protein